MARAKQKSKKASEDIFFEDSALSAETFSKTKGDIYEETDEESRPEKDETEEKLEKLVFGDDEEFQKGLKTYNEQLLRRGSEDVEMGDGEEGAEEEDADDDEKNIEEVDDADLFFLDSGTVDTDAVVPAPETPPNEKAVDEFQDAVQPAVWEDSDEERLVVSLASNPRLRKLRDVESDDLVTGKEYIRRLRRQYLRLHPTPAWALPQQTANDSDVDSDVDAMDSSDDEAPTVRPLAKLLQGAGDLIREDAESNPSRPRKLRQEVISVRRLRDVGGKQPSSIDSLSFHPHYPLLLSSGPAKTLWLHHISPNAPSPNPLVTSLHIRKTPVHTSVFAPPMGNKIFVSGRRRYFHTWDLDSGRIEKINALADRKEEQKSMERFKLSPCGRYMGLVGTAKKGGGLINVLDASTAQWVRQVRVDGQGGVADFAWWRDGNGMCVASKNGEVSEYDLRERRVIARWHDAGAVGTTVVALGGSTDRPQLGGDRWIAIGSSSGIVNIYDRRPWAVALAEAERTGKTRSDAIPTRPSPVRALDQLTTAIGHLEFSKDGQFMVMASRWKRDALRLVHLPSCTVYRNWPTQSTNLGRVSSVAISPESNMLAVANENGHIRLFEILG
ncbi:hypothetical protein VTN49DRAFT_3389 [Thermomyces lanuginosus]|uniref:uncharacterized protein n=1 Tax=Thermomyces lanuginosus TaxID=5541 RepID=UPI0037426E95